MLSSSSYQSIYLSIYEDACIHVYTSAHTHCVNGDCMAVAMGLIETPEFKGRVPD